MSLVGLVIEKLKNNPEGWKEYDGSLIYGQRANRHTLEDMHGFVIARSYARCWPERPFAELRSSAATYKIGYWESYRLGRAVNKWREVVVQSKLIEAMLTGEIE